VLRKLLPSGVWHFHHKTAAGPWTSTSTKHRDKDGAIEWAEGFSLKLTRDEHGLAERARKPSNDLVETSVKEWLAYHREQSKTSTSRTYASVTSNFLTFLKSRPGCTRLGDVDREVILAFRQWHLGEKNAKKTADNNLVVLRSFFNWCVAMGKIGENPVRQERHGVRLFYGETGRRIDTYTITEYAAVIEAAPADLRIACVILGNTGLRISELAMLEWSDVDLVRKWLHVRSKTTNDGIKYSPKDDTDRQVTINAVVEGVLSELATSSGRAGYVLPLPRVKSRVDYAERSLLGKLKDLAKATGIKPSTLTLHNFRRYFVSQCADCGIDMACVMEWVGHDEMKMVMHYNRLRDQSSQRAMTRFTDGSQAAAAGTTAESKPPPRSDAGGAVDQETMETNRELLEHLGSGMKKPHS